MADLPRFITLECTGQACGLRFPAASGAAPDACPRCGESLRKAGPPFTPLDHPPGEAPDRGALHGLLDNLRSVHNVGSVFRTADGAGVAHLSLCGITPTPENPRLAKAALGAEVSVRWSYHPSAPAAARDLKAAGAALWAVEGGGRAEPLFEIDRPQAGGPLVVVLGSEKAGIDPELLALCDRVLSLPMQGRKRSLNAAVAFGIAVYTLRFGARQPR